MKEHTLDILTAALIKYGTRVFWAAVIVFVGLRIIRIARRAAGQIMDRAGVEITLKSFWTCCFMQFSSALWYSWRRIS